MFDITAFPSGRSPHMLKLGGGENVTTETVIKGQIGDTVYSGVSQGRRLPATSRSKLYFESDFVFWWDLI